MIPEPTLPEPPGRDGSPAGAGGGPDGSPAGAFDGAALRPAGFCTGPGHIVVYGNAAFLAEFGETCVGLPAREGMLDMPPEAFAVLDAVFASGRPLARWIRRDNEEWRITAAPRVDPESAETYGVAFHLRARSDTPILRAAS